MIKPQPQTIEVVQARELELPRLFGLAMAAFSHMPEWDPRLVADVLSSDLVFVARVRGTTAGYVAIAAEVDGWRIDQLLVASGHERRGIGKLLLAYAEAMAARAGAPSISVVCEQTNFRGRDLYRRVGFTPVGPELWKRALSSPH